MGTTRDALEAGSANWVWVVAIEGFPSLITNGSTAAAVTAWAGTDYVTAIDGLHVDLSMEQRLDPDSPIGGMGTCTLWIQDELDVFGVALNKKTGAETYLENSLNREEDTVTSTNIVTVKSTSAFDASGVAYIGTEAFAYSGKTSTTFTGVTRGKYSPFAAGGGGTPRFAHDHRVALDSNSVKLQPIVSANPRTWRGKNVGVWIHRVVGGVLDVKAEAECVFAGIFDDHRDDANTGATVVQLKSVADWVGDRVLGSGQYEATVGEGVYLEIGQGFALADGISGLTDTANELLVVAPGSFTGPNYMPAGIWSLGDLCSKLNEWVAAERTATRINFTYIIKSPFHLSPEGPPRTVIGVAYLSGSGGIWRLIMPGSVAKFLGFEENAGETESTTSFPETPAINPYAILNFYSKFPPLKASAPLNGGVQATVKVTTTSGEFADQRGTMPASIRPADSLNLEWGLFVIGDSQIVLAAKEDNYLTHMRLWKGLGSSQDEPSPDPHISFGTEDGRAMRVRQILAIEYEFATAMALMFMSTGTEGYNESFLDILPRGMSLGVPLELLGDEFISEVPGTAGSVAIIIDKPKKFREVVESDLIIRWAYLRWVNGTLKFGSWKTPSALDATYTLDDTNKAESSDVKSPQRSATEESDEWQKSIVKIEYNRDVAKLGDGGDYQSSLIFEDRVAVDDQGGASKVHTISLSNTFTDFAATGQSAESLLPVYMANMPLISRPARRVDRSISPPFYWKIGVGDTILFSDRFARDPATGERGITDRPALVVKHTFRPGGLTHAGAEKSEPMGGRVTLFFTDADPDRTAAAYVPSADLDDTATVGAFTSGYNSAGLVLRCYEHRYSESTEAVDASHMDGSGYKLLIIERDPLDPTSPLYWERDFVSRSGNDITHGGVALAGFDSTRKYRILFQSYATAVAAQKAHSYQADDADGLITTTGQPFQYGSSSSDSTFTANSSAEIELVPSMAYANGFGRDVGHEVAVIRQIDNFVDYKGAIQAPRLFNTIISNTTVTGTDYLLAAYWPVFLSHEILSNAVLRYVSIKPWAYSTDGTSTKIRVTLCRDRPSGSSLTNHTRGTIFSSAEWTGITSTTPGVIADTSVEASVKHPFTGVAWVMLELGYKCATRGLARFVESARVMPSEATLLL